MLKINFSLVPQDILYLWMESRPFIIIIVASATNKVCIIHISTFYSNQKQDSGVLFVTPNPAFMTLESHIMKYFSRGYTERYAVNKMYKT